MLRGKESFKTGERSGCRVLPGAVSCRPSPRVVVTGSDLATFHSNCPSSPPAWPIYCISATLVQPRSPNHIIHDNMHRSLGVQI